MLQTLLHNHSEYSIGDSILSTEKLCEAAQRKGYSAVSLSDHGVIGGIPSFLKACKKHNLKPILGVELYFQEELERTKEAQDRSNQHICIYAKNKAGYFNLVSLVSESFIYGQYFKPRCDYEMLNTYKEGLVITTACMGGMIAPFIANKNFKGAHDRLTALFNIFGKDNVFVEVQISEIEANKDYVTSLQKFKDLYPKDVKFIIGHDSHYADSDDFETHEIFLNIHDKNVVGGEKWRKTHSTKNYVRSHKELSDDYRKLKYDAFLTVHSFNEAVANCDVLSDMIEVYDISQPPVLPDTSKLGMIDTDLNSLVLKGFKNRGMNKFPKDKRDIYKDRLLYELKIINGHGFAQYFVSMAAIINVAKEIGVKVGVARGSSGGSLVNYLLGNTDIDPIENGLLFERFLNPARKELPDIDTDFSDIVKLIDELKVRYGENNVVRIATYSTYLYKGLIGDLSRVYGIDVSYALKVSKSLDNIKDLDTLDILEVKKQSKEFAEWIKTHDKLELHVKNLHGIVRHKGQHAAGVLITPKEAWRYFPIEKLGGVLICAYTEGGRARELSEVGGIKFDILGLNTLRVHMEAFSYIAEHDKKSLQEVMDMLDASHIDLTDEETLKIFRRGDTQDIFQFESDDAKGLCKSIKPDNVEELCAINAINRPGPLQAGCGTDYAKIKKGTKDKPSIHPIVDNILNDTYGMMLYQEQIIRIAKELGNLDDGEAEKFRKVVFKLKGATGEGIQDERMKDMEKIYLKWSAGAIEKGMNPEAVEQLWEQIQGFMGYSFNKSHSAAYTVTAFISAYLKAHWPIYWYTAYLNNIGDPDKVKSYLKYLISVKGISIVPPSMKSIDNLDCVAIDDKTIALGISMLKGVHSKSIDVLKANKENIHDFISCFILSCIDDLNKTTLEGLIKVGFFDDMPTVDKKVLDRGQLLAYYGILHKKFRTKIKNYIDKNQDATIESVTKFFLDKLLMVLGELLVTPLPPYDIYSNELEIMSFSLQDHPAMRFKDYTTKIGKEPQNAGRLAILGFISEVKIKTARNKKKFGVVTVDCLYDATYNTKDRKFKITFWDDQLKSFNPVANDYGIFVITPPHETYNTSNLVTFINVSK